MVVILLNLASGVSGQRRNEEVKELVRAAGIDARIRELDPHDIRAAAREALDAHSEAVVAGGGDGTVSTVASTLAGTSVPLGVLPLGTLNHFAKDAGIPLDLEKAVQTIAAGHTRRVDVGRVNDCTYINNSSIGVYPSIVEARERLRRQGKWKWVALTLAITEALRRDDDMLIRLQGGSARVMARTPFVFVGNNEYVVEGIKLGVRTRLDAGRLYAYFAPPVRTRELPRLFAQALVSHARRDHALESLSGAELWIDTPQTPTVNVACDGELHTLQTPLHYRSWPGALTVLAPAD